MSAVTEKNVPRTPIEYIPNDSFDSATEQDFAEIDVQLYAEEDDTACGPVKRSPHESFLVAVEQSRILTYEGEQFLFKRLNFLKFRASALQASLKGRKTPKTRREIDRLLGEANETRDQIACANLRLITSIVRKIVGKDGDFDEFLAEANTILLGAIDKFDYARGYRFSTYATHAVQRHCYRLMNRNRKRHHREGAGASEEIGEVADFPRMSAAEGTQLMEAADSILSSFDEVLDEREQRIVRARFGLDGGGKGQSMRAIGDELGLSKERVRQILNASVEKLAKFNKSFESVFDVS